MNIKNLFKDINKKEWLMIVIMIFFIIIITSIPHIYGFLNTPDDFSYLGRQALNSHDTPVYFSYLEQVKQGEWLFKNLFTSESQTKIIFNPFWLGVGLIGKLFLLPVTLTFQIARILLIPILIIISYLFISFVLENKGKRKICFILLLFSSGLGALFSNWLILFYHSSYGYINWSMDLWVPESNIFFTFYHTPHLIASLSLILLIFLFILLAFENNKKFYSILAGIFALFLFQFHPFHIPTIFGILSVYLLFLCIKYKKIKWNLIKHFIILILISLPSIIYHLLTLKYNWLTWQKAIQNVCLTPSFLMTLISYGLLIILALIGLISIFKNKKYKNDKFLFLIIWPITQLLLIYSPLNFQRRLTEGLHVGIVLLASFGLFFIYNFLKNKMKSVNFELFVNNKLLIFFVFILFFALSNIVILWKDVNFIYAQSDIFYISNNKKIAIKWLAQNTNDEAIIFSSPINGNIIPAFSARTVYAGHGVETAFYLEKIKEIEWFFKNNKNDAKKYQFCKKNKIDYLFYGNEEKKLGEFNPEEKDYLEKIYQNKEVNIYKIKL
ncbi:hypothetical protein HY750_01515 [Candidatus Kuenenbacteria bacterium]|nr:hypothetical protein [Candidatus Kuenenbacteria bacterium]